VSVASAAASAADGVGRTTDRLLERPRIVLGSLIGLQLVATIVLALRVEHNGWVWFQGGDQIVNTTTGWLAGQRILPPTEVSYLWPLFQTPITWLTGPTFLQALPPIVLLQVLVLGPIALLCVYDLASRIGGRLLGYWASLLWVIAPFAVIPLFVDRYQERWTEQFVPQALGLTAMPDFPSMVLVLLAAVLVARSLASEHAADVVLAGLLAGAAGGLKPPNYLFATGAVLGYVVARRWRALPLFALAMLPSLLVLAYWKEKGYGYLPALAAEQVRLAAGVGAISLDLDRYLDFDLDHWRAQMDYLREFFWSARVAQWAPIAGLLAVLRVRRAPIAALLAGWLGAFLVVKGFSPRADIQANTFWRLLMPAWPAYLLLFAAIPLLVPTAARRLGTRLSAPASHVPAWRWSIVAAVATLALPALAIAAAHPLQPPDPPAVVQYFPTTTILTPVDDGIAVAVSREGDANALRWTMDDEWRAEVFYQVYRWDGPGPDTLCSTDRESSWSCYLRGSVVGTTRDASFTDLGAPTAATYRVGVGTNWANDPALGDIFAVSPTAAAAAG
jgi:hypothetical protein